MDNLGARLEAFLDLAEIGAPHVMAHCYLTDIGVYIWREPDIVLYWVFEDLRIESQWKRY